MKLQLKTPVLDRLEISRADLLVDIAVGLYVDHRVTLGQAADVAEMPQSEFRRVLGRLGVPVQYDRDDLNHDLLVL